MIKIKFTYICIFLLFTPYVHADTLDFFIEFGPKYISTNNVTYGFEIEDFPEAGVGRFDRSTLTSNLSGTERISFSDSSGYEIGFGLKRDSFWLSLIAENYSIENTLTGNAEISFEASPEVLPILNSPERSFDSYEQFLDISDLGHSFFGLEVGKFFTENEESKPFISARLGQALLDYDASGAPAPENLLTMLRV